MNASSDVSWDTVGGDYSEENASKTDYAPDSSWENYDVADIVQQFTNGTTNYGFLIVSDLANGNTHRYYYASEYTDLNSLRPKLTITYTSNAIITCTQYPNLLKGILLRKDGSVIRLFIPFEKDYRLSLFNSGGKIIETVYGCNSQWYQLKATELSNGIYFIRMNIGSKIASCKLILVN